MVMHAIAHILKSKSKIVSMKSSTFKTWNSQAVKHDERYLVLHDLIPPATSHLSDSIDASNQDYGVSDGNGNEQTLEAP